MHAPELRQNGVFLIDGFFNLATAPDTPANPPEDGARAAFTADEAPGLRKIDENEARWRADRLGRHIRKVLAGVVQTPYARGVDPSLLHVGDGGRGRVLRPPIISVCK